MFIFSGLTNALVFYRSTPILSQQLQPSHSDSEEINDDYNHVLPFPPFFNLFRHRNLNPFYSSWNKEEKREATGNVATLESTVKYKGKLDANNSLKITQKNIEGNIIAFHYTAETSISLGKCNNQHL